MGQMEQAQHCLGRAIFLKPQEGHTKYLSLAQLMTGVESRDLYLKAIEIISSLLSSLNPEHETRTELRRDISNAYVSLSEIYMTDLCDEPEAEIESKRFIDLSVEADETNPESFQARANYLLITGNSEDAKISIGKSIQLWLPAHLKFLESGEGEDTNLSYTFRLSTAKILLDLEDYDNATKVLDGLIEEDEEVVSTWYLLGWLNYLRSQSESDYQGNARYYLRRARDVNTMAPTDDQAMIEHITELLTELGEGEEEHDDDGVNIGEAEPDTVAEILDQEADGYHPPNQEERMED
ncbi:probable assembly chaperone of rpl4 [Eurytemora carolleeae]|uniref:probable assembly chaperone of rpl4 n=1 Tax=Eurytemora carolleeae TaxID=1294199 RepID=UPI000C7924A7|nr:probable assembly chaperone of rpl4 [Eurytemora carolleeae]|eukprot:XP_023326568.1 probable assembly chaperone of rpl4 [Eurytemora affinis]